MQEAWPNKVKTYDITIGCIRKLERDGQKMIRVEFKVQSFNNFLSNLSFSPPQMRNSYLILDEYVRTDFDQTLLNEIMALNQVYLHISKHGAEPALFFSADAFPGLSRWQQTSVQIHPRCGSEGSHLLQRLWWEDVFPERGEVRLEQSGHEVGVVMAPRLTPPSLGQYVNRFHLCTYGCVWL